MEQLTASTIDFLESVLPPIEPDEIYPAIAFTGKKPTTRTALRIDALARFLTGNAATSDVYFAPVVFKSEGAGRRANNVSRCRVVWLDMDCGEGKPYATVEDAIAALKQFPLKPHWVVCSGRGLHVYWLLTEPVEEDGFPRLMAVVRGLANHLHGDHAAALRTQLLRPPGTLNHKPGGPYPVEVMYHFDDATTLGLDDFEDIIAVDPEVRYQESIPGEQAEDDSPANLDRIVDGCAWLRHTRDDAATLPEPEWYAMLGIVARTETGEEAAHEWSQPHPGYTASETDQKLHHSLEDSGPRTCAAIAAFGGDWCNGCAFKARVKSPITIGRGLWVESGKTTWANTEQSPPPLPPLPGYPVDVLPDVPRRYVAAAAASLDIEPDIIATMLLPIAGAALGNRVRIELKRGWTERPILWAVPIAPAGSAKSAALSYAMAGTRKLQAHATETYIARKQYYDRAIERWTASKPSDRDEKPIPPHQTTFYITDTTMEALAGELTTSDGIVLALDELTAWARSFDAYRPSGKGRDRQDWLTLWDGGSLKIHRKGNEPIFIEKPAVGVTGGLQPARLPELVNPDDADGFVDRVLFSWPKSEVPGWTEDEVDEKTETAFVAMFQRLSEYAERVYPLSTESKRVWVNWFNENTRITESLEGAGRGLSSKLPRQLARITLILHCMEEVYASQVSAATMRAAIEIVEYHREHGLRVLGAVSKIVEAGLKARIVRALSDSKCEVSSVSSVSSVEISFFISLCKCPTRVELHRLLGGHVLAADLDTAISSLEADGKVIRVPVPSTKAGGRPGERLHYLYEETEETEETPPNSVCHSCGQILRDLEKCDCGDTTPSLCPGCSLPLDARFTVRGHCPSCAAKQTAKGWH